MGDYDIATGDTALHGKTMVSTVVDTVTLADYVNSFTLIVYTGTSVPVYVTADGSTPAAGNANARVVLPGERRTFSVTTGEDATVKLVSASAAVYSIEL